MKRYKRFFADFLLDGKVFTAHVPNTGSLKGVLQEGQECLITKSSDTSRKLPFTLQMLKSGPSWVGVNTSLPNLLVEEAFQSKNKIVTADRLQREYKISAKSRLDFATFKKDKLTGFIEVKNVTLAEDDCALFPDCVTTRGLKHLAELLELKGQGYQCHMIFVVQREDCEVFAPAEQIDPDYAKGLRKAIQGGVQVAAYKTKLDATGIELYVDQALRLKI